MAKSKDFTNGQNPNKTLEKLYMEKCDNPSTQKLRTFKTKINWKLDTKAGSLSFDYVNQDLDKITNIFSHISNRSITLVVVPTKG